MFLKLGINLLLIDYLHEYCITQNNSIPLFLQVIINFQKGNSALQTSFLLKKFFNFPEKTGSFTFMVLSELMKKFVKSIRFFLVHIF